MEFDRDLRVLVKALEDRLVLFSVYHKNDRFYKKHRRLLRNTFFVYLCLIDLQHGISVELFSEEALYDTLICAIDKLPKRRAGLMELSLYGSSWLLSGSYYFVDVLKRVLEMKNKIFFIKNRFFVRKAVPPERHLVLKRLVENIYIDNIETNKLLLGLPTLSNIRQKIALSKEIRCISNYREFAIYKIPLLKHVENSPIYYGMSEGMEHDLAGKRRNGT